MIDKAVDRVALTILAAIVTAWLYGLIEPLIPARDGHSFIFGLFVVVVWPFLIWLLPRLASARAFFVPIESERRL
jgi:hypothetical protein